MNLEALMKTGLADANSLALFHILQRISNKNDDNNLILYCILTAVCMD